MVDLQDTPPNELGVHPTSDDANEKWATVPYHQSSLMCDDINATIAELRATSMAVDREVQDPGFGLVASIQAPSAGWIMLYEP